MPGAPHPRAWQTQVPGEEKPEAPALIKTRLPLLKKRGHDLKDGVLTGGAFTSELVGIPHFGGTRERWADTAALLLCVLVCPPFSPRERAWRLEPRLRVKEAPRRNVHMVLSSQRSPKGEGEASLPSSADGEELEVAVCHTCLRVSFSRVQDSGQGRQRSAERRRK